MIAQANDTVMNKAVFILKKMSADDKIREAARIRERALHDEASYLEDARNEGIEEGIGIGRAEGRAEGSESSNLKAIKNLMVNLKLTFDQATNAIGLTPEEQARYRSLAGL